MRHRLPRSLRAAAAGATRDAVADYLHTTHSIPFHLSQLIASSSPSSLAAFLSSVHFPSKPSRDSLAPSIHRRLRFFQLLELDFLHESIGADKFCNSSTSSGLVPTVDGPSLLSAAVELHRAGFPWGQIGVLYSAGLLRAPVDSLVQKVQALSRSFQCRQDCCIVAACVVFPSILLEVKNGSDDGLLSDVAKAAVYFARFEDDHDVDYFLPFFRKMRAFYDAGMTPGTMGEHLKLLVEYSEANIMEKLSFFERLGMKKGGIGPFALQNPEVFDFDLEGLAISVPEYLGRLGVGNDQLTAIRNEYPHVIGRNRLINLPGVLQAVGLDKWFLSQIIEDDHYLHYLSSEFVQADSSYDLEIADEYLEACKKIESDFKTINCFNARLKYLHQLGFGENKNTANIVPSIRLTEERFRARFDFLLKLNFKYSDLCRMIAKRPNLLNRSEAALQKRVHFLIEELGYPLQYLCHFPVLFSCDVERLLKPRHNILNWLQGLGITKELLSPSSLRVYSDKRFVAYLYGLHPAAPKQWLEVFSAKSGSIFREESFWMPTLQIKRHSDMKRKRKEAAGWVHADKLAGRQWKCKYCGRKAVGPVSRLLEHVAGIGGNLKACTEVDGPIREAAKEQFYQTRGMRTKTTLKTD